MPHACSLTWRHNCPCSIIAAALALVGAINSPVACSICRAVVLRAEQSHRHMVGMICYIGAPSHAGQTAATLEALLDGTWLQGGLSARRQLAEAAVQALAAAYRQLAGPTGAMHRLPAAILDLVRAPFS